MTVKECFDFSHSKVSTQRRLTDYSKIQDYLISPILRNNPLQKYCRKLKGKEYLNVGCGENIRREFINLDYHWRRGIDLCWDIRKKLPFSDKSIKGIYSEHCLEHFSMDECLGILIDFKRILNTDGNIRIVIPDAELYLDLYQKNKSGGKFPFPYATADCDKTDMMYVNEVFRSYGHRYAYDAQTLTKLLNKAGFINIQRRKFMNGKDSTLLIDTQYRSIESLYMEASA